MKRWIVLVVVTIMGGVGMAAAAGLFAGPVSAPLPAVRIILPGIKPAILPWAADRSVLNERIETERLIGTQA